MENFEPIQNVKICHRTTWFPKLGMDLCSKCQKGGRD